MNVLSEFALKRPWSAMSPMAAVAEDFAPGMFGFN
jgi:hypothetical protein